MKNKKQKFVNMIGTLAIVFTLTFSTNMNATAAVSSLEAPTSVALTSTHLTSISLTGNWWNIGPNAKYVEQKTVKLNTLLKNAKNVTDHIEESVMEVVLPLLYL